MNAILIKNIFYFGGKKQGESFGDMVDYSNNTLISEKEEDGMIIKKWRMKEL